MTEINGMLTPENAPRDARELAKFPRFHLRALAESIAPFTHSERSAFLDLSTKKQAERLASLLAMYDEHLREYEKLHPAGSAEPAQIRASLREHANWQGELKSMHALSDYEAMAVILRDQGGSCEDQKLFETARGLMTKPSHQKSIYRLLANDLVSLNLETKTWALTQSGYAMAVEALHIPTYSRDFVQPTAG